MANDYPFGMPGAEIDNDFMVRRIDEGGMIMALHIETDPISGVAEFALFTDDRRGNGECVLKLPLRELRDAIVEYSRRREVSGQDC